MPITVATGGCCVSILSIQTFGSKPTDILSLPVPLNFWKKKNSSWRCTPKETRHCVFRLDCTDSYWKVAADRRKPTQPKIGILRKNRGDETFCSLSGPPRDGTMDDSLSPHAHSFISYRVGLGLLFMPNSAVCIYNTTKWNWIHLSPSIPSWNVWKKKFDSYREKEIRRWNPPWWWRWNTNTNQGRYVLISIYFLFSFCCLSVVCSSSLFSFPIKKKTTVLAAKET